jgi:nucleoside-diphosphate-sugar epimerase
LKNNQYQEKKLRILVTGGTGFIGSRLTRRLIALGKYHIRCMTRNPDEIYQKIFGLSENIIEIVRVDATKYEEVLKALEDIDVVFI